MKWADTPRAVAKQTEITFTMVTNTEALHAVTGGPTDPGRTIRGQNLYRHEHGEPRREP